MDKSLEHQCVVALQAERIKVSTRLEQYRTLLANRDNEIDRHIMTHREASPIEQGIQKKKLANIERALQKADEGTLGVCDGCGHQIPEARLREVMLERGEPVIDCVNCHQKETATPRQNGYLRPGEPKKIPVFAKGLAR